MNTCINQPNVAQRRPLRHIVVGVGFTITCGFGNPWPHTVLVKSKLSAEDSARIQHAVADMNTATKNVVFHSTH